MRARVVFLDEVQQEGPSERSRCPAQSLVLYDA
jgi:hypothetical protein